jgi:hypothetical protein
MLRLGGFSTANLLDLEVVRLVGQNGAPVCAGMKAGGHISCHIGCHLYRISRKFSEFPYSKNRMNVAVSRARCLAILVANHALMAIRCATPEQMALVNTLCWVRDRGG